MGGGRKKRSAAKAKKAEEEKQIALLLSKYDPDGTGKLDHDELVKLLTDLSCSAEDGRTKPPAPPTQEEVDMVIRECEMQKEDGQIQQNELRKALSVWKDFQENREFITEAFEKYDKDNSGKMDKEEMKHFLAS